MAHPGITPGDPIRLKEGILDSLGKKLNNRITDLEDAYTPYFNDIRTWWKWYYAEPRSPVKNFPFRNAANVVIPLSQIASDGLAAQALQILYGQGENLWTVRTENEDQEMLAKNVTRYVNWQAQGNDFDMYLAVNDWLNEVYPIGSSVLAINWSEDKRFVWTGRGRKKRGQMVRFSRGPQVEHSPRENYLWDTSTSIMSAPEVMRKFRFTYSQIRHLSDVGGEDLGWIPEAIEKTRHETGSEGPDHEIYKDKKERDGMKRDDLIDKELDYRECHLDWPVLGEMGVGLADTTAAPGEEDKNTPLHPVVLTIHRKTGRIVRAIAEPYNFPTKPFVDGFFKKRPGRGSSEGVSKRLEQLQITMTTLFNQALDSNTRANALWAMTSNRRHLQEPIDPSRPKYVPGMEKEFRELNFSNNPGADVSLMTVAQTMAERVTGQSDPAMGRETRHGGHPSPATSTLALLNQSQVMASGTNRLLRNRISTVGMMIATLDQQFETDEDGRIDRILGPIDGEDVKSFLFPTDPIFGNYQFQITAMTENNNPQTEMQRAVTVSQMAQTYWSQVIQGSMALDSGRLGPAATRAWLKAIEAGTRMFQRFLEATNVDDLEKFTLDLRQAQQQAFPAKPSFKVLLGKEESLRQVLALFRGAEWEALVLVLQGLRWDHLEHLGYEEDEKQILASRVVIQFIDYLVALREEEIRPALDDLEDRSRRAVEGEQEGSDYMEPDSGSLAIQVGDGFDA